MRRPAGKQGFTLIECAIVALIVGVLAAICPSFNGGMALGLLVMGLAPLAGGVARKLGAPLAAAWPLCLPPDPRYVGGEASLRVVADDHRGWRTKMAGGRNLMGASIV